MHLEQALDGAGRSDTAGADVEFLLRGPEIGDDGIELGLVLGASLAGCLHEKVV